MSEFLFCFTMDDIAMEDYSSEAHFERILDFCREMQIKATFFVLPRSGGKDLRQKPGYIELCRRAVHEGHELGQHGLDHDRFEAGIPPKMILDMSHEGATREYLANHREELAARHTVESLRKMLAEGRQILQEAVGIEAAGFRGPSGAFCDNLLPAMRAEGYFYDATIMMQTGAWDLLNNNYTGPAPITRARFDSAQTEAGILEIPGAGEYTWYLDPAQYAITMDLAKHDFHRCLKAGIPFVAITHVSPILQTAKLEESELGLQFYRELLSYCRSEVAARGMRFTSLTLADFTRRQTAYLEQSTTEANAPISAGV